MTKQNALDLVPEGSAVDATTSASSGDPITRTLTSSAGITTAAAMFTAGPYNMGLRLVCTLAADNDTYSLTDTAALTGVARIYKRASAARRPTVASHTFARLRGAANVWKLLESTAGVFTLQNAAGGGSVNFNGGVAPADGWYCFTLVWTIATATTGTIVAKMYDRATGAVVSTITQTGNYNLGTAAAGALQLGKPETASTCDTDMAGFYIATGTQVEPGPLTYPDVSLADTAAVTDLPSGQRIDRDDSNADTAAATDATSRAVGKGLADPAAATDTVTVVRTVVTAVADTAAGSDRASVPNATQKVGPANEYASDPFTLTAGSVLGAPWTISPAQTGTFTSEASGRLRATNATTALWYHSSVATFADGVVAADITFLSGSGYTAGVVGRLHATAATYYMARMNNSGAVELVKSVAGTITSLGQSIVNLAAGETIRVALKMNGSEIVAFGDGVALIVVTDTSITAAGRAGIRATGGGSSTAGLHFDNWQATDLPVLMPTDTFVNYHDDVQFDFSTITTDLPEGSFVPRTSGDLGEFDPASPGGAAIGNVAKGKATGAIPNETLSDYDSEATLAVIGGVFRSRQHWVSGRGKAGALKPRYLDTTYARNYAVRPRIRIRARRTATPQTGGTADGWGSVLDLIGSGTDWANGGGEWGNPEGNHTTSPLGAWTRPANHLPNPNDYDVFYRADTAGVPDTNLNHWHTYEFLPCDDLGQAGRMRLRIDGVDIYDTNTTGGAFDAPTNSDLYGFLMQAGKPGTPSAGTEALVEIAWFKIELPNSVVTSPTPADTAPIVDLATITRLLAPVVDTAAATDAVLDELATVKAAADAAAGTDTVLIDRTTTTGDTAAGTDASVDVLDTATSSSDPAAGADQATLDQTRTATDTAAGSDTAVAALTATSTATDTAAAADAVTVARATTTGDSAAGSDTSTPASTLARQSDDVAAGADTAGAGRELTTADTATGGDASTDVLATLITAADPAAASDSAATSLTTDGAQNPSDPAGAGDTATVQASTVRAVDDTAGASDAGSYMWGRTATPNDIGNGSDTATWAMGYARTPGDTAAGTDSAATDTSSAGAANPNDTAAGVDVVFWELVRTITDTAAGADQAGAARGLTPADPADAADQAVAVRGYPRTPADPAAGTDALVLDQARAVVDTAAATDQVLIGWARAIAVDDPAAVLDEALSLQSAGTAWADTATGGDLVLAVITGPHGPVTARTITATLRPARYSATVRNQP